MRVAGRTITKMATVIAMTGPPWFQSIPRAPGTEIELMFPWASMVIKGKMSTRAIRHSAVIAKAMARCTLSGRFR
jgi:hypothetical protein